MQNTIGKYFKKQIFDPIVDVFFPPICYICDCYLHPGHKIICENCWSEIPAFDGKLDQSLSNRSFDNLFILFEFEDKIRQLIHLLKYKRHLTLAQYFACEAKLRFSNLQYGSYHAIVPVPLYKTRKRERGYNQSEEIANALSKIYQIPVKSEHLLRIRPTSSQTKMSREQRDLNMLDAFNCPQKNHERRILLIDDVITTGSTIDACAKALKKSGINEVDAFAVTHPPLENN